MFYRRIPRTWLLSSHCKFTMNVRTYISKLFILNICNLTSVKFLRRGNPKREFIALTLNKDALFICHTIYSFFEWEKFWASALQSVQPFMRSVDRESILDNVENRRMKSVTDIQLVSTALHPRYKMYIHNEDLYDRAFNKLKEVAVKRGMDESQLALDFGDKLSSR